MSTSTDGLVGLVAAVLREHQPKAIADNTSRPGFRIWRDGCSGCDWIGDNPESHVGHVAEAVTAALPDSQQVQQIQALARSWYRNYDVTPANDRRDPSEMDQAYDDAGFQILYILGEVAAPNYQTGLDEFAPDTTRWTDTP